MFTSFINNKKTKQISSLYISMLVSLIVGIGMSVFNARILGPRQYGDFKFMQTLFNLSFLIFTFGFFVSGGRLIAEAEDENIKSQLIGALFFLAAIVSMLLIFSLFLFSFFEEGLFNNGLGWLIRFSSPLLFVFLFNYCLKNIMQGDNRIYELSLIRTLPQIAYLVGAIALNFFVPLSLTSALFIQLGTLTLINIVFIYKTKYDLNHLTKNIKNIIFDTKIYGFPVYIGTLANLATGHLTGLSIGYYVDNINLGYYALALHTAKPLAMFPSTIGTVLFKDFTKRIGISKKATSFTIVISIIPLLVYLFIIRKLIIVLYSHEYAAAVPLAYWVAIGSFFSGLADFYNRFLGAHGKGKYLRNTDLLQGTWNCIGVVTLVNWLGATGAAITKCFSGIIYFLIIFFYYRKYIGIIQVGNNNAACCDDMG